MSLNWNLAKIKDFKKVCWEKTRFKKEDGTFAESQRLNPITDTLIWACMFTGHQWITTANFREFFRRLNLYQADAGGLLFDHVDGKPVPVWLTLQDVERHIGLVTNCTKRSKKEWAAMHKHPEWATAPEESPVSQI